MKRIYKKVGESTIVIIEQRPILDYSNALEVQRFVIVAEINAMRSYILNMQFNLRCNVLEKVVEDIDLKLKSQ